MAGHVPPRGLERAEAGPDEELDEDAGEAHDGAHDLAHVARGVAVDALLRLDGGGGDAGRSEGGEEAERDEDGEGASHASHPEQMAGPKRNVMRMHARPMVVQRTRPT